MAISPLKKAYIFVPRENREDLLEELQKAGIIHIESDLVEEIEEEIGGEKEIYSQEIDLKISQAEYVIDYLRKYEKKLSIAEQLEEASKTVDYDEFDNIESRISLDRIYREVYKLTHRLKDLNSREGELRAQKEKLKPYLDVRIDFEKIKDTPHVKMKVGTISEEAFKRFHLDLEDVTVAFTIHKILEGFKGQDYFFIAYHSEYAEKIEKLLTQYEFRQEDLNIKGTPRYETSRIVEELEEIEKAKKGIIEESIFLADWLDRVKLMYDYLISIRERKQAEGCLFETGKTAILKGWYRFNDYKDLNKIIEKVTPNYEIVTLDPDEKDRVPVELTNPPAIAPMEFVTKLYGTPKYDEYDPTIHIFLWFILFFAICLTDAGYGIMLLILSIVLLKYMGKLKLLRVLLYGACVTIVAGFITGGFWGIDHKYLPPMLQGVFNVNEKALMFLAFTLFLGVAQMVFGFFLGAKLVWDHGYKQEAAERALKGVFFGAGAPVVIATGLLNTKLPGPFHGLLSKIALTAGFLYLLIRFVSTILDFKFEGPPIKQVLGFILTILKGVVADAILNLVKACTDFLGNMLSYSRLMALGLATGGIGMVINLLAGLVRDLVPVPVLGILISILVLVVGHVFNLVISSLGAFVHTARLQYVEFFPYFFEGGGRPFDPFSIKTKYNKVVTQ